MGVQVGNERGVENAADEVEKELDLVSPLDRPPGACYHRASILTASTLSMAQETLPVVTGDKDRSLQEVLTRLTASRGPVGADADPIVTAAHRLPAIAASFAPYPEGTDERLRTALAARGVEQLYTHQAEAFAHVLGVETS